MVWSQPKPWAKIIGRVPRPLTLTLLRLRMYWGAMLEEYHCAMNRQQPQPSSRGIRAVIFDLDGTLVDSAGEIASALNRTLVELERAPLPRNEVEALIGRGVRTLVERALRIARVSGTSLEDAVARFERHYASQVGTEAMLYPGVRDGLVRLEAAKVPMAVVTNKPRFFTERLLERLGIDAFFAACIAGDDGIPRKPAGDMLLAAARAMGIDIDSAIMLGDSA